MDREDVTSPKSMAVGRSGAMFETPTTTDPAPWVLTLHDGLDTRCIICSVPRTEVVPSPYAQLSHAAVNARKDFDFGCARRSYTQRQLWMQRLLYTLRLPLQRILAA
jgi:hypothetical protein